MILFLKKGIQRKGVEQTIENRKMTAYHEGGHALVAFYTEGSTPLHKATIIQRGSALGMVCTHLIKLKLYS